MDREEMLEYMPHRGRNVLIDDYEDNGEMKGRGHLTISPGDIGCWSPRNGVSAK